MTPRARPSGDPIRLGVSTCLLGREVRFDGGHKRDRFLVDVLGNFVEWVPVCPEVESGMPTPRPALRLEGDPDAPALVETKARRDHTQAMRDFARERLRTLATADLSGYVLKSKSPSCGMERVRVYGAKGQPQPAGRGLYARALLDAFPELPVEEEGRLHDARLRENFIERVFAYTRLRGLLRAGVSRGDVVAFHTAHKLQLMAHSPARYRSLGRLVARIERETPESFAALYAGEFMAALRELATRGRNTNVLQHAAGYLREGLDDASRHELVCLIEDYRTGLVPLVVPITLLAHHVRRLDVDYLAGQVYLEPHPKELMLRNHV